MRPRQQIRFCAGPDGARIAHASLGSGPPIVLVRNWLTHLEHDFNNPAWSPLLEELCMQATVVRFDQRGTGLSDRDVGDVSLDAWLSDLEAVVQANGLQRFTLMGISLGGAIAAAYAARHPEQVSSLILHASAGRGRCRRGSNATLQEESELNAKMAELGWSRTDQSYRQFFTSQFLPQCAPERQRTFNELSLLSVSAAAMARNLRVSDQLDLSDALPKVQCATLVLHATDDPREPFDEGRLVAGLIPQAHLVPLSGSSHLPTREDPSWKQWLEEVQEFLRAQSGGVNDPAIAKLTSREREILELIAQGRDNAQLAAVLQLSDKTVRNHITNIFAKLEVESRSQAIVLAREAGLGQGP